ncbi:hypothetical protein [Hymenobacter sp. IS2118]|uniref:hypothetical protein n=1 Tax=Hymenobacter sp. IS2118 TaxID=1505605 RepID=UPI000550CAE2|nr:hypothetical protein [Hymenobacter sp. IS2118]
MPNYPSLLLPTCTEILIVWGQTVAVPKAQLQFRAWDGPALEDTFGNKPLIDFGGRPVFAELCVYELFRLSGWDARWVETYGAPAKSPKMFTSWLNTHRSQQQHQPLTEAWVAELLAAIAAHNNGRYGGCWDVLGWHNDTAIFAELKRLKKDRLQTTQPAWLEAGLKAGLQPENFLLVEWDFLK